jgi:hypothetical protein
MGISPSIPPFIRTSGGLVTPSGECMDVWMYGCMEVWMCGCMEVWMCGALDVWTCGSAEVRKYEAKAVFLMGYSRGFSEVKAAGSELPHFHTSIQFPRTSMPPHFHTSIHFRREG